jgi:DNA-binding response OmpR family regulator
MQVILVSHSPDERDILTYLLKHTGLSVATSPELFRVTARWLERPSDLIVIAWHDGSELTAAINELRSITQVPLLLISTSLSEDQHCGLLQAGVDIILIRPVAPRLLVEYVRGLLRRTRTVPTFVLPPLNITEIQLDPDTRIVTVRGQEPSRLTQLEFRLLYVLMVNRGQVIPVDTIVERVWGYSGQSSRELVRGLVSRLRRKIEPDPHNPRFIQNIPGVGYLFSLEDDP